MLSDDLDEETWHLVGRARSLRSALQQAAVVKAGHLDELTLLATANATLWDVAHRCARLTGLLRARERAGAYDVGGLLPAQTVQQTDDALTKPAPLATARTRPTKRPCATAITTAPAHRWKLEPTTARLTICHAKRLPQQRSPSGPAASKPAVTPLPAQPASQTRWFCPGEADQHPTGRRVG